MHLLPLVAASALGGCTFNEDLNYVDLSGVVRIPKEAARYVALDPNDEPVIDIIDPRAIGPVYLGAYPAVTDADFGYLHPETGPVVDPDQVIGNAFPYGGTTVGRMDWGCYQVLTCRVVTGRYASFQDALQFFNEELGISIVDEEGTLINDGDVFRERCYDQTWYTGDHEVDFLRTGVQFRDGGDYWEADFSMLHVRWVEGMTVWGWMDAPSSGRTAVANSGFNFSTCIDGLGPAYERYALEQETGASAPDVLNYPDVYIDSGDWVASEIVTVDDRDGLDGLVITLGDQQ